MTHLTRPCILRHRGRLLQPLLRAAGHYPRLGLGLGEPRRSNEWKRTEISVSSTHGIINITHCLDRQARSSTQADARKLLLSAGRPYLDRGPLGVLQGCLHITVLRAGAHMACADIATPSNVGRGQLRVGRLRPCLHRRAPRVLRLPRLDRRCNPAQPPPSRPESSCWHRAHTTLRRPKHKRQLHDDTGAGEDNGIVHDEK
jgi:hypothetical protein